ncbi:MAG: hypothetical protein WCX63_08705 [Methanoregula sp.]
MEWIVEIDGDSLDLDWLLKGPTFPEFSIQKEDEKYFLISDEFKNCSSYSEVKDTVTELLAIISVGCQLCLGSDKKISIKQVTEIRDDGKKYTPIEATVKIKFRGIATITNRHPDGNEDPVIYPAELIRRYIHLVNQDPQVAKAFRYIFYDFSSPTGLGNIIEILEDDQFEPVTGGKYHKDCNNITGSLNNPTVSGVYARHAKPQKGRRPPQKTVPISEAQSIITSILKDWLLQKESHYNIK